MAKVTVHKKEEFEKALKQFKRICIREGIFRECRERMHYTKPSVKKRRSLKNKGKTQNLNKTKTKTKTKSNMKSKPPRRQY